MGSPSRRHRPSPTGTLDRCFPLACRPSSHPRSHPRSSRLRPPRTDLARSRRSPSRALARSRRLPSDFPQPRKSRITLERSRRLLPRIAPARARRPPRRIELVRPLHRTRRLALALPMHSRSMDLNPCYSHNPSPSHGHSRSRSHSQPHRNHRLRKKTHGSVLRGV